MDCPVCVNMHEGMCVCLRARVCVRACACQFSYTLCLAGLFLQQSIANTPHCSECLRLQAIFSVVPQ